MSCDGISLCTVIWSLFVVWGSAASPLPASSHLQGLVETAVSGPYSLRTWDMDTGFRFPSSAAEEAGQDSLSGGDIRSGIVSAAAGGRPTAAPQWPGLSKTSRGPISPPAGPSSPEDQCRQYAQRLKEPMGPDYEPSNTVVGDWPGGIPRALFSWEGGIKRQAFDLMRAKMAQNPWIR